MSRPETAEDATGPQPLHARLRDYRQEKPRLYGYLRNHWEAAEEGLHATDRAYARTEQILENVQEADVDSRTLGCVLTALSDLDLLHIHTSGGGKNLYDLRSFDETRFGQLPAALD